MHRHYEPTDPVVIPTRRILLDPEGLRLVVWLPETDVPDVARFAATIEQRFDDFVSSLDRILDEAIPTIESAIDYFWQIPDERGPTAKELLETSVLTHLNLNAGAGSHVIIIHDQGDLIGSHDLVLSLTEDFHPASAHFDG